MTKEKMIEKIYHLILERNTLEDEITKLKEKSYLAMEKIKVVVTKIDTFAEMTYMKEEELNAAIKEYASKVGEVKDNNNLPDATNSVHTPGELFNEDGTPTPEADNGEGSSKE